MTFNLYLSALLGLLLVAQGLNAVPERVVDTFESKYGENLHPEWNVDVNGYWEAEFEKESRSLRADFHPSGEWIETEHDLVFEELPDAIRSAVRREFGGQEISEIELVDHAKRGRFYDVEFFTSGPNQDIEYREDGSRAGSLLHNITDSLSNVDSRIANIESGNKSLSDMTPAELFFEFGLNLVTILLYAYGIYYLRHHDHKMMFLILAFNLFLFPIFLLNSVLTAGFGFTIFALLAMVRLRSENFDKAEIAYLLGAVALTFINSQMVASVEIVASLLVLLTAFLADHPIFSQSAYQTTEIRYRLKDNAKKLDRAYLSDVVSKEYGIAVNEIEIDRVSRKEVRLTVIYKDKTSGQKEDDEEKKPDEDGEKKPDEKERKVNPEKDSEGDTDESKKGGATTRAIARID